MSALPQAPASLPDFAALAACWHPVAYASALTDKPLHTRLLGRDLVLWRDGAGTPRVLADLCIHRGTALSLGRVVDGQIMCPYHGWRYDGDGRCTLIPQLADPTRVPAKARVAAYQVVERHRLLWVALAEPRFPLPDVPELVDEGWTTVETGPFTWNADASRQLENFTDLGHFPWLHPGLLGDPERPVVPGHTVHVEGAVLRYDVVRPEAPNSRDFPVFGNEVVAAPERRSRYALHLPYTIALRLGWGGQAGMMYLFASQPVDHDRCTGYVVIARNYDHDQPDEVLRDFEDTIFEQDRIVVESQRPERVRFDLADELHLTFDAVAVAYRRAMRAQGLAHASG